MASPASCGVASLMYSSLAASVNTNSPPSEPGRLPNAGVCADTDATAGAM